MPFSLPALCNKSADGKFSLPADGLFMWVPLGEAPNMLDGKPVIQVVDRAALDAMAAGLKNSAGKMLVDYDHLSHLPDQNSVAAGWGLPSQVEVRDDGLWGPIELSNRGQQDIEGGNYRYLSPEFDASSVERLEGKRIRPTRLVGLAVTNRPNFREISPLTNKQPDQPLMDYKQALTNHLQIPAEATDEQITAALANAAKAAEDLRNARIDAALEKYAGVIVNKEKARESLANHFEDASAFFDGLLAQKPAAAAAKPAPLHNKQTAPVPGTPEFLKNAQQRSNEQMALVNRHLAAIPAGTPNRWDKAWQAASAEKPELFSGADD